LFLVHSLKLVPAYLHVEKEMHANVSHEWWKIKVYNEVAEFLKHPSLARKMQLDLALNTYEEIFKHSTGSAGSSFSEMELAMNDQ